MEPDTATLIREALALDVDQRALVANTLLASIHDSGNADGVDDTWRIEVAKRLDEMRSGTVELIDADEHFARLRASLGT